MMEALAIAFDHWQADAVLHFAGAIKPGLAAIAPARFFGPNVQGSTALTDQLERNFLGLFH